MTRAHFDQELQALKHRVIHLGNIVEKMVVRSVHSLRDRDLALAERVIADDSQVDVLAYLIEDEATILISRQQPIATDLRRIAAALVIIRELERIGDHAEDIARISLLLCGEAPVKPLIDIPLMAERAVSMLQLSFQAYLADDEALARQVWEMDDQVDDLYDQFYRELLTCMMNDPMTIERATRLLNVAHDLERIGDRVTNICERIVYIITGEVAYIRRPIATSQKSS